MDNKKVVIKNSDNTTTEVDVITYLIREDKTGAYLVYSKGEKVGDTNDNIIYISKIVPNENTYHLATIGDDNEWVEVQNLLKKIANA